MLFLLLLQASAQQPDIEIGARVDARSVTIERKGEARLNVQASPDGGSTVEVAAPEANGSRTLRNVHVTVDAKAEIGDPRAPVPDTPDSEETSRPK